VQIFIQTIIAIFLIVVFEILLNSFLVASGITGPLKFLFMAAIPVGGILGFLSLFRR
jgi:hypothetical protein